LEGIGLFDDALLIEEINAVSTKGTDHSRVGKIAVIAQGASDLHAEYAFRLSLFKEIQPGIPNTVLRGRVQNDKRIALILHGNVHNIRILLAVPLMLG
jgi:hypothetical protein